MRGGKAFPSRESQLNIAKVVHRFFGVFCRHVFLACTGLTYKGSENELKCAIVLSLILFTVKAFALDFLYPIECWQAPVKG